MAAPFPWWYPAGAQVQEGGVAFRVWAGSHKAVSVRVKESDHPLKSEGDGYFSGEVAGAQDGDRYGFVLDGEGPFPDPASRFQPDGPHGASQVIDPRKFDWTDGGWKGICLPGQVVYELHIGTFTKEGTWAAAIRQLPALRELGVTVIEVMPVNDFCGAFGWGYDGVDLYAPARNYGSPDDFRAFVDAAHKIGLGVILDVVYNHVGPDGNYLAKFSKDYFTENHTTEWGEALNFYGENSGPVRAFFACNAAYWVKEYHLDGLRLDATQSIFDTSQTHILAEVSRTARRGAEGRDIILVAENEPQDTRLIRPYDQGGYGIDAMWNDDFHHSAMVAATGSREAYFSDYLGTSQELVSAVKYGFLFQGQWYTWQKQRRGSSTLGTAPAAMVAFIQNHDQVANSAHGQRLHELTSHGQLRALTALCLLGPATPMLFQGQEFAASAPFLFFADHNPQLAELVRKGRAEFLDQWPSLKLREVKYDDPCSRETFEKCKLDWSEREKNRHVYDLHRDLLALRKSDPLFSRQDRRFDGATLGPSAFVVRFFSDDFRDDRMLVVNLGREVRFSPSPEPLLGPPTNSEWGILWSSEDPRYGGNGTPPLDSELNWIIPAHGAVVLKAVPKKTDGAER